MLIILMGDSCVGKSTIAKSVAEEINATVISGKDYLRMAKNPDEAAKLFTDRLASAVCGENIIYVITEKELLALLPKGGTRVFVTAGIDTVKERFAARMHGVLPPPVSAMLEKKYNQFETEAFDIKINTDEISAEEAAKIICEFKK